MEEKVTDFRRLDAFLEAHCIADMHLGSCHECECKAECEEYVRLSRELRECGINWEEVLR